MSQQSQRNIWEALSGQETTGAPVEGAGNTACEKETEVSNRYDADAEKEKLATQPPSSHSEPKDPPVVILDDPIPDENKEEIKDSDMLVSENSQRALITPTVTTQNQTMYRRPPFYAVPAAGAHYPASPAQNGIKSPPPFPSRRSPGANLFDRAQGFYHAGVTARQIMPATAVAMEEQAPLDLSKPNNKTKSPREVLIRDVDSPLDLSVKTRKRSADTTDNENDDDVIFLKEEGPPQAKYAKDEQYTSQAFKLQNNLNIGSPRRTFCKNNGYLMSPSPVKEPPLYTGTCTPGNQVDRNPYGSQADVTSNQHSPLGRPKFMQQIIPTGTRTFQPQSRPVGGVTNINPHSQPGANKIPGSTVHIPTSANNTISPERRAVNRSVAPSHGNLTPGRPYTSKTDATSHRTVSPAALDAFMALRQKSYGHVSPHQEMNGKAAAKQLTGSPEKNTFQNVHDAGVRQCATRSIGQIPPMPPLIKVSPSAGHNEVSGTSLQRYPANGGHTVAKMSPSPSKAGPEYQTVPNHHYGAVQSRKGTSGLYQQHQVPHVGTTSHTQSVSQITMHHTGTLAAAQGLSQIQRARMSAPLPQYNRSPQRARTQQTTQQNTAPQNQMVVQERSYPEVTHVPNSRADLVGEPRVHTQPAQPHHRLNQYSDIMAKNITQTTEKYQFPLRTVTNATTAELVGQPRVKQSLPDYKLGQVPDSTARHETTGKLSEYSADTTHVLASRAVFAYHKAAMHYAKSKMAAGTLQQHSSASIEITSGNSVDAVKSGHLNDTSTSHFGISRENMPSLGNQTQANSNNTNCTGRTTGQPAFGHQRSTVTALPDNNANMRVQNDETYQAESTKADNTRSLSKNDGVPRQHSLKEDFIRAIKKYEVFNVNPLDVMKLRNASESAHSGSIVNGTPWTPANKTEAADAATNAAEGPTSDSIRTRSKKQRSDNQVLVPVSRTSGAKVVQGAVVSNHFSTNESCSRHENIATSTPIAFLPFQITHPITANVSRATHSYTSTQRNTERQNLSLSSDPSGQSLSGRSATATSAETASSVTSSKVTPSVLRDTSSTSVTPLSSVPNLSAFMPTGQGNKSPPSPVRDSHQDGPQTVVPSTRPASMLQAIEQSARAVTYRDYKKPTPVTSKIVNNKGSNKPGSSNRPNTRCRAPAPSGECNATDEDELIKYRSSLRMPPQLLRTKVAPNPARSNTAGVDSSIKPYISVTKASVSPAKLDPGNSGRYADSNTKKETGNPIKSEPIKGELCNKEVMLTERCGSDAGKDSVQSDVSKMTCIKGEPTTETRESHSPKGSAIQTKSPNRKGNRKPGNRKDTKVQPKRGPKGEKAKCKAELLQTTIDTREFSEKFVKTFGRKHSQGLFETLSKSLNVSSALNDNTSIAQSNQSASGKDVAKVSPGSRTEKSPSPTDNSKKDDILTNEEIKNIWCRMKMEKQQEKEVGDTSSALKNEPPKSVTISPERDDKAESINAKRNSPKTMKFTTKKFSMNLKKLSPLMRKASQALMQEMQRRGHLTRMNGSSGAASGKKSPRLSPKRPSTPIKSKSLRAESPFNSSPRESPVKMETDENELEKRNTIEQTAQEETKPVPKKEKEATRPILQRRGRQLLRNQDFDSESGSRDTSLESRDTSLDSQGRPSSRTRRTRMLEEIANTDGFVAERRGRKIEDLFAHPSELDREARWLQRAMMKFSEMETKPDGDDLTASRRRRNPNASALTKAAQLRRRACRFTNKSGLTPQKFSDFSPEILPTRTRGTGLERIRRRSYNKNAAYEAELSREEERLELKRANRQAKRNREQEQSKEKEKLETSTEMSVDEGDESQVDADDISPVRGRRKKRGGKQSTGSRGSKRTKKVEVEIDYAGCEDADTDEYYYEDNYAYEGVSEDLPSHLHDELNDMIDDGTTQSEEQFDKPAETNDSCAQDRRTPPLLKKLTCSKTSGETVLHRAARMGYEDVVLHCLETKRVDINAKDNAGYTPLHESCVRGNLSVAKHLLEFGANVNCSSQDGIRPIHDAVENDHVEIVRLLLSYGADPTLVTYSGKTLNKIARSKAMKTFLEGYFADLKVGDKSTEIHPWEFAGSSSILDPQEEVGYDIFADMPSDSDSDCGYESDIEFEMGDKPHVPCYNIVCEDDHGPCNYVVLFDVLDYLDMKKNDFINFHGNLTFVSLKMSDFAEAIASSVVNNRCKWVTGDMAKSQGYIELVKLDDNLRRIFGTSMERLPKEQPAETQVVELVNAGSVVTPSTSSAPNNMLEPDDMRVSIKKEISDYDEEPVQMETDFTQSGSADVGSPDDDEPPVLYVMCDPAELQRSRFRSPVHPATTEAPDAMMTSFDGLHERGAVFAVKEGTTAEKLSAELPFPPAIRPIIQAKPSEADAICELRIADVCSLAGKGVELFNNSAGALPGMFESQVSENKARRTENGMDEDTDDDMPQLTMCT